MSKKIRVGRVDFGEIFASVVLEPVPVNSSQAHFLGDIYQADEDHDGKLISRIRQRLPKGKSNLRVCIARPFQREMTSGHAHNLVQDYGLRHAPHHVVRTALQVASPDQVDQLFYMADQAMRDHGLRQRALALSVVSMGSSVAGKTTELIPVHEVIRSSGQASRVHLRRWNPDMPMFPAEWGAYVYDSELEATVAQPALRTS